MTMTTNDETYDDPIDSDDPLTTAQLHAERAADIMKDNGPKTVLGLAVWMMLDAASRIIKGMIEREAESEGDE